MSFTSHVEKRTEPTGAQGGLGRRLAAGVAVAVVANVVTWAIGDAALDPIVAPAGAEVVTLVWPAVVAATIVGIVFAAAAGLVLRRIARRPRTAFVAVIVAGTLLSLGGPFSAGLDAGNAAALAAMHLITGAVAVVALAPALSNLR